MPKIEVQSENEKNRKEEAQFARKEIVHEKKNETLEKLYQNKEFQIIQKPPKIPTKTIVKAIIISLILGFILGIFFTIKFLSKQTNIPLLDKIISQ